MNDVVKAAQAIFDGYTYFPKTPAVRPRTGGVSEEELLLTLTNREVMVLQGLAQGKLVKDIAEGMLLSHKTVSTYKARVLIKLNLTSTFDLIEFAKRHHLIDAAEL
ncbi:MAG: LuxR C-terminal-related transcriptional regulator [Glaciimonas sp.]|nr:LuxR C-terminal-related transcriptional regulator [Glaciimonas sp.]